MANSEPVVVRNTAMMGGHPIFRGTRVQAEILFKNLAEAFKLQLIATL